MQESAVADRQRRILKEAGVTDADIENFRNLREQYPQFASNRYTRSDGTFGESMTDASPGYLRSPEDGSALDADADAARRASVGRVLKAFDRWAKDNGNSLNPSAATSLGLAYGAVKGFASGVGDLAELGGNGLLVVGNKLGIFGNGFAASGYEYFDNMAAGLRALRDDPSGVLKTAFGDRFDQISALSRDGKHFEAAALSGEMLFEVATVAAGGVGLARAGTSLTINAARSAQSTIKNVAFIARNVSNAVRATATELGVKGIADAMSAGDLAALTRVMYRSGRSLPEAEGVAYAYVRMNELGGKLLGDMVHNGSGHGLDMVFEMPGNAGQTSRLAVIEAKHGDTLGALREANGARQGSYNYIENQLRQYANSPGADQSLASRALKELRAGSLESYAVLRGAERVAKFDLMQFINKGNLNANKYFEMKYVPRP